MSEIQNNLLASLKEENGTTAVDSNVADSSTQQTNDNTEQSTQSTQTTDTTTETKVEEKKVEIDDSAVLSYLKSKGLDYSSLEDLKPKEKELSTEEIAALKEQEENDKFSWAIKNVVSKNKYESYLSVVKDPLGAVLEEATKEAIASDPDLDVEEFESDFKEKYGVNAEENTVKFKQGKKAIETLAKELVREKFPEVLTIDSKYEEHKASTKKANDTAKLIEKELPIFNQRVETSLNKVKTFKIDLGNNEVFEYTADAETVKDFVAEITKKENATSSILNKISDNVIDREIQVALLSNNLPNILNAYKSKVIEAYEKERRGVGLNTGDFIKHVNRENLTKQDEVYNPMERFKQDN